MKTVWILTEKWQCYGDSDENKYVFNSIEELKGYIEEIERITLIDEDNMNVWDWDWEPVDFYDTETIKREVDQYEESILDYMKDKEEV